MRRYPIEDDADAGCMGLVDETGEAGGIAVSPGRGEEPDRLIAPGGVERVLADRQQLDMGEAEVGDIGHQPGGQFVPGEKPPPLFLGPRAEMDLVDRHRPTAIVARPRLHPGLVGPLEDVDARHHRSSRRPHFAGEAEGVGLERQQLPLGTDDLVFVGGADADTGGEDLPDAAVDALAHLMAPAVPGVEVADHRDAGGIGRPQTAKLTPAMPSWVIT